MFNYIDNFLIDGFFEPFSHLLQKWIGITCFNLSRICIFIYVFLTSVYACAEKEKIWIFIDITALCAFSILSYLCCFVSEMQCSSNLARGFKNPARLTMQGVRKDILAIVILLIAYDLLWSGYFKPLYSLNIGNGVASYFMACTPLPPGKSKARKAWEKLKEKIIGGELAPFPA